MNDTVETTLLLNLFYYQNETYSRNEVFIESKKRKAISILDEYADELKEIDGDLYNEYKETITFLEGISEEEYQNIKNEIIESVKEFIKNER